MSSRSNTSLPTATMSAWPARATAMTPAISRSLIAASVPSQAPTSVFIPISFAMRGVCSWPSVQEKLRTQRVCGRTMASRSRICASPIFDPGDWPSR